MIIYWFSILFYLYLTNKIKLERRNTLLTDIQIAQSCKMLHIRKIGEKLGITEEDLEYYGNYKAKLSESLWDKVKDKKDGKLVLVTAINPTPEIGRAHV